MFVSLRLFYTQKTNVHWYSAEGFQRVLVAFFFKRTASVKQGKVFSQLCFLLILDMLSRTYSSSHATNRNGCSKDNSEAFLGLWDLSSVTDVAQFWRLLLIPHRGALLLGYKFRQTSGHKVLPKSTGTERGSSGETWWSGKGERWSRSFQGGCGGWRGENRGPWHRSPLFGEAADWFPAWQLGLVLHPPGQTSAGWGMKRGAFSARLSFLHEFCRMHTTYQLSDTWKKHRRKRGSLLSPSFPQKERIGFGEGSSLC